MSIAANFNRKMDAALAGADMPFDSVTARRANVWRAIDEADCLLVEKAYVQSLFDTVSEVRAERDRLLEALTPNAETKATYMGEFQFPFPMRDQEGEEVMFTPSVPWVTIKEIMAAIRSRAVGEEKGS